MSTLESLNRAFLVASTATLTIWLGDTMFAQPQPPAAYPSITPWWTVAPAVVGACGAAISAVFAGLVWWVYKGQWRTMGEQAAAAKAAQQLNETVHRPWVNLWSLQLEMPRTGEPQLLGVFNFRNSGGTPAFIRDVRVGFSMGRGQVPILAGLPVGPHIPRLLVKDEDTNWRYTFNPPLAQAQWDGISEGRDYLLIVGSITYEDASGTRHTTRFAREYDPTVNKPGTDARFRYPDLPGANDAD
jgi:hypothetical protein